MELYEELLGNFFHRSKKDPENIIVGCWAKRLKKINTIFVGSLKLYSR